MTLQLAGNVKCFKENVRGATPFDIINSSENIY